MNNPVLLAGCVLLDPYDRILLLHRNLEDEGQWELPGGKVEEGETPVMAAVREIQEELGVSVEISRALGDASFEQDETTYTYYWFLGYIHEGVPDVIEADTFDDLDYFEIEDLPSLALSANMEILHHKLVSGEVALEQ